MFVRRANVECMPNMMAETAASVNGRTVYKPQEPKVEPKEAKEKGRTGAD